MDVEENVKLGMERNVEEALSKLIPVKSKEIYLVQYKLFENWKNIHSNKRKYLKIHFEVIYMQVDYKITYVTRRENLYRTRFSIPCLAYGSSGKHLALKAGVFNPRAACGPWASFVRPGKGISLNTMRYEY